MGRIILALCLAALVAGPSHAAPPAPSLPVQHVVTRDTGNCDADLVLTEIRLRQASEQLSATARAPLTRRCAVFRDHVRIMRRAAVVFSRCTTGHHARENVAHMRASIADWNTIIARDCR